MEIVRDYISILEDSDFSDMNVDRKEGYLSALNDIKEFTETIKVLDVPHNIDMPAYSVEDISDSEMKSDPSITEMMQKFMSEIIAKRDAILLEVFEKYEISILDENVSDRVRITQTQVSSIDDDGIFKNVYDVEIIIDEVCVYTYTDDGINISNGKWLV